MYYAVILLLISLACSKEIEITKEYGSLRVSPDIVLANNSKKDGNVNRGTIPVYVSEIEVNTENTNGNSTNTFTLVDNGGEDGFLLRQLALGSTSINATTKSNSQQLHEIIAYANIADANTFINSSQPYAVYENTNTAIVDIEAGIEAQSTLNMQSLQGRLALIFSTEESTSLVDSYDIDISITSSEKTLNSTLSDNSALLYYWSNENAVESELITVSIKWKSKADANIIDREEQIEFTIYSGISLRNTIKILDNSISSSQSSLDFEFIAIEEIVGDDIIYDADVNTNPPQDTVIDLDFLMYDDVDSRIVYADGSVGGKTTIGDFTWYAHSMEGQTEKLLSETNFDFDIESEYQRLTIYLRKDSTTTYKTIYTTEDFEQLKIDYADYYVRTDYSRSTIWGSENINYLLRLGEDSDTIQKAFKINKYSIN